MWQTKEDVLNDLQEQTGGFYGNLDHFVVRGEKPPPSPFPSDEHDDEFRQRLPCDPSATDDLAVPDYAGITHMLRMVDAVDDPIKQVDTTVKDQPIIITKLNPYVDEFIPKTQQIGLSASASKLNDNTGKSSKNNSQRESPNDMEKKTETNDKTKLVSDLHKTIGENKVNANMEQKRARNVALAALLKLYSTPAPVENKEESIDAVDRQHGNKTVLPEPVLYTPEYFASPSSSKPKNEETTDKLPLLEPKKPPSPKEIVDPEIKKSVSKVENWLNPGRKKSKSGPYTGPIIFTKRDSPSSSTSTNHIKDKISPKSSTIQEFVPSKYAEEYRKEMAERVKAQKENEKKYMNIWDKLELNLKERDKLYRKRLQQQSIADKSAQSIV